MSRYASSFDSDLIAMFEMENAGFNGGSLPLVLASLAAGLTGGALCAGMCGGIAGAIQLEGESRAIVQSYAQPTPAIAFPFVRIAPMAVRPHEAPYTRSLLFNLGRITECKQVSALLLQA